MVSGSDAGGNRGSAFGKESREAGTVVAIDRGDSGSNARFFYCAKASKAERDGSKHPTVKPLALMRWLTRLVTPPGGTVLDPFAGTGTTGEAAQLEGFDSILIERDADSVADIHRRMAKYQSGEIAA
jgi:site-specific DNA-methyltransferase (adenine-specific)